MASKFLPSSKLSPVSTKRPASMAGFGKQVSKYTYDYIRLHQPALLTQQSKRTLWAERFTSSLASSTVYWLPTPLCLHKAALFVGKLTHIGTDWWFLSQPIFQKLVIRDRRSGCSQQARSPLFETTDTVRIGCIPRKYPKLYHLFGMTMLLNRNICLIQS